MKIPVLLFIVLTFFTCCNNFSSNTDYKFVNDLEYSYVWTDNNPPNIIRDDYARSGISVCRLDESFPYSPTFNIQLKELDENLKVSKVIVSAWLRSDSSEVKPEIILEYRDANKNVLWVDKNQLIMTSLNKGEWAMYAHEFKVDSVFASNQNNYIRTFFMNSSKSSVLCDDVTVMIK
jgi:hypothetical protein